MATPNVIIDPVTRIEGHLRIQAYATPDGKGGGTITAPGLSASTMVRGVERILQGRDPRDAWAFTQRICGVCTVVHGLTSVRAVESAIGVKVPKNADYIRNMMIGAQYVHDHVMHFYHLHALDWVDVVSALSANPTTTAKLAATNNPAYKPNSGALPNLISDEPQPA
jgi:hydrogenase large subunit